MSAFPADRELVITRLIDAAPENVFRCWVEPELLKQWFAPRPWTTPIAEVDARPGGVSRMLMRGPNGEEAPAQGVYLEITPGRRIVFTDAFTSAWAPKDGQPFMLGIITFEPEDGKTRYIARVRHWTVEATKQHEAMGFSHGWGQCAEQLEMLARTL